MAKSRASTDDKCSDRRIEIEEILFTTLILLYGEPPRLAKNQKHHSLEEKLQLIEGMKSYALQVRDMMAELGHDPHQGLYTSYIYWCNHEWKSHRETQEK